MNYFLKKTLSIITLGSLSTFAMSEEITTKEINFGIISTESSQNLRILWDPFLADMSQKTGYKVNAFFASDYAGIIQAMRFDKVEIAWLGNKAAVEAVDRAGGEVFAQTVALNGADGYWSLLIAHKDSPYNSVEDLLAHANQIVFGNGDPNSTSGFLVPGYYVFAKNGVEPNRIFKRTLNSSHETNALAVANKQIDVATFNSEGWSRLEQTQPEKTEQLKIIWKSPLIPSDPIVWRKNLDEQTKSTLKSFLINYGKNEKEMKILSVLEWAPFRVSSNAQLLPIRQLELFKQRGNIENNTNLSEIDKSPKLSDIDKALDTLSREMQINADKNKSLQN